MADGPVVGSSAVEIVPSAENFGRKLSEDLLPQLKRIGEEAGKALSDNIQSAMRGIRVQVDTTAARADVDEFRAMLDRLGSERTSHTVDVDTLRARADLDELRARLDEFGSTETTHTVRIRQAGSASGEGGSGFGLMQAGIALSPALIPIAAAAVPLITGIGMAATGAAAGVGVLKLAFTGIGTAVSALGAQSQMTGQQLAQQAAQQLAAADSILSAQEAVANSVRSLADAQNQAAQQAVQDAESVKNAETAETDARRSAAAGIVSAEQNLTSAQQTETNAQLALTAARKQAAQTLVDLSNQVKDGALSQRQATLDLQAAQQNLTVVDFNPHSTPAQRAEAQLQFDQAKQHLSELGTANARLADQKATADKQGVAGAPAVVSAQQALANATQARTNAQVALTEAQRAGAESVAKAQQAVTDAMRQQTIQAASARESIANAERGEVDAQRALALAYAQAGAQGSSSANAVNKAMAALTPAGRAFALFVNNELKPAFKGVTDAAQEGFLPGFQKALTILLPYLPGFAKFVGDIARELGNMAVAAAKALTSPFWKQFIDFLGDTAKSSLGQLGQILGNLATGFAGLFEGLAPSADGLGGSIVNLTARFADFGTHLSTNQGFQKFLTFIKDNTPGVVQLLKDIGETFGKLIIALAPLGATIALGLEKLFGLLANLTPGELIGIAAGIGAIAIALTLAGGPLEGFTLGITAITIAVTAIAAALVYAYTHFQTFHDIVNALWKGVSTYFKLMWELEWKPVIELLILAWRGLAIAFQAAWDNVLHPTLHILGDVFSSIWNDILQPMFQWIGDHWSDLTAGIKLAWDDVLHPVLHDVAAVFGTVWDGLTSAFDTVGTAFGSFRDGLSAVWTDIKTMFADGVNFVTQDVLNKFIDGINKVTHVLGIPPIDTINKITIAKPDGIGGNGPTHGLGAGGTGGRAPSTFATGGVVPGYAPGVDSVHAILSPGEGVLVPEAVRGLGAGFVETVNRRFSNRPASNNGHFAGGGLVKSIFGGITHAAGDLISGAAGAALSTAESPIKAMLGHLSPEIVKTLAQGGFNAIDNALRSFIHAHPAASDTYNSGTTAVVSGPNTGSALDYAKIIIQQAKSLNLGPKGAEIGLMTALVESNLKNYANINIPASLKLPHDAVGSDHFSAGLFQQQTGPFGNYWGTVAQVMNPAYSAHRFYDELLKKVPGYQTADPGVAAQTVQVSAKPDAYIGRKGEADSLIAQLKYDQGGYLPPGVTQVYNGTGKPEPVFTPAQLAKMGIAGGHSGPRQQPKLAENITLVVPDPEAAMQEFARRQALGANI